MNCPVCSRDVWVKFETKGDLGGKNSRWFSGEYGCYQCGKFTASGSLSTEGERSIHAWIPLCPDHGVQVTEQYSGVYHCKGRGCHRIWEVSGGRIHLTRLEYRNPEHSEIYRQSHPAFV